ncbi:MAG TPA: hypothetical protein V6C78_32035 [Crinalium sp.]
MNDGSFHGDRLLFLKRDTGLHEGLAALDRIAKWSDRPLLTLL